MGGGGNLENNMQKKKKELKCYAKTFILSHPFKGGKSGGKVCKEEEKIPEKRL